MRDDAPSGSACRSVAAGPAASGRLSGVVPTTTPCGVVAVRSSSFGSDCGLGAGLLVGSVCACAPANEMAMKSNNPARDVFCIGKFRAGFTKLVWAKPVSRDKCRLDSPIPVTVVNSLFYLMELTLGNELAVQDFELCGRYELRLSR